MKTTMMFLAAMMTVAAQGLPSQVTAKVPFAFEVRGQQMAAGAYSVAPNANHTTLKLQHQATGKTVVFLQSGRVDNRPGSAWLRFRKYGDQYFLDAVAAGGRDAAEVGKSKRERELAKAATVETVVMKAE